MALTHNYLDTAGFKPTAAETEKAELVVNLADGTLWSENVAGTVIQIGGGTYTGGTGISIDGSDEISHDNHTGDVTSSGTMALTIGNGKVTLAKMANMATASFIGRTTASTGVPEILSKADALSILDVEDGAEVNNISDVNATDLTDAGESTLHYHDSDRSRANHTGTQTLATISDSGTAAGIDTGTTAGKIPVLDGNNQIPSSMMPPLAITTTYTVASEVAQLALTVEEGDVAVRTDENKSYIALNATNGSMSDWTQLLFPTAAGTNLAIGTVTGTTVQITSSSGNNVDLTAANTDDAGLLTAAKFDEIVANSLKETNVDSTISTGTRTATTYPVDLDGGASYSILLATTQYAGIMSKAQFDILSHITVTQAVDLDTIESNQVGSQLTGEAV